MKILQRNNVKICSGISVDSYGNYLFDYNNNSNSDIINIVSSQIYEGNHGNNVYWFGYKFNDTVSSKERTRFINYVNGIGDFVISDDDLEIMVERPLAYLDEKVNLYDIDCFVYPLSGRSDLVRKMVRTINRFTSRDMSRISFELIKSVPTEIEFDWRLFKSDYADDPHQYEQMKKYVEEVLMPSIKNLDYFSLAHSVKPKYRKYIRNYLNMSKEDAVEFSGLKGKNILIVDDINTSGSTIDEILRIIGKINHSCNIYIYTLIGK